MALFPFTEQDDERLKQEFSLSYKLGLLVYSIWAAAVIAFFGIIEFIKLILHKGVVLDPMLKWMMVVILLVFPFLAIFYRVGLVYIDLKRNQKSKWLFTLYDLKVDRDDTILINRDNREQKIVIEKDLMKLITPDRPLHIEITPLSKTKMFISHDGENLLDRIYDTENLDIRS
ncbi:MAG TPA: hypothetical protein VK174_03075 [Chitinophagales bacterium]|nr:hypothetical protein [Chitinophagales bacterium]